MPRGLDPEIGTLEDFDESNVHIYYTPGVIDAEVMASHRTSDDLP